MTFDSKAFIATIRDAFTIEADTNPELVTQILRDPVTRAKHRMGSYIKLHTALTTQALNAERAEDAEPLKANRTVTMPSSQLAYTLREAIDSFMMAEHLGDFERATIAANTFNLAALELNEVFRDLKLSGTSLTFQFTDSENDRQLPQELISQLTQEELAILPPDYTLDECPTEEEQPFCDVTPCLGCELRRKILNFKKLLEVGTESAGPH